ncbi:hypothetical protein NGRA_3447 [Nosema granulosis]|uniref:Integrase catalytic domain-containing protein n=1 Tax=Nosema granulosis TaxID=83296 RepID=A0A9P6KWR7_9MICR|nr:hypothetical protein NGRA_3447 [Nosema granulosis]
MLILDQSKENLSGKIKDYPSSKDIVLHYTTPFHHQSNGRVERYNRTLQDLIYKNKEDKFLYNKVKRTVEVYNMSFHTGLQMTPNEAMLDENRMRVKEIQFDNIIRFNKSNERKSNEHTFIKNDIVLVKEEVNLKKGSPKFRDRGKVTQCLDNNSYMIQINGKEYKRHASQLKLIVDEIILKPEGC